MNVVFNAISGFERVNIEDVIEYQPLLCGVIRSVNFLNSTSIFYNDQMAFDISFLKMYISCFLADLFRSFFSNCGLSFRKEDLYSNLGFNFNIYLYLKNQNVIFEPLCRAIDKVIRDFLLKFNREDFFIRTKIEDSIFKTEVFIEEDAIFLNNERKDIDCDDYVDLSKLTPF